MSIMNFLKESFCPERTFAKLQGEKRQMRGSADLDVEQETRVPLEQQLVKDIEEFRIHL